MLENNNNEHKSKAFLACNFVAGEACWQCNLDKFLYVQSGILKKSGKILKNM